MSTTREELLKLIKLQKKQNEINRLQQAAIQLIDVVNTKLPSNTTEGIFRLSVNNSMLDSLFQQIIKGEDIHYEKQELKLVAVLLKKTLRELAKRGEPLFKQDQADELLRAKLDAVTNPEIYENKKLNCVQGSPVNKVIILKLLSMMNDIPEKYTSTRMKTDGLATVVGPNFFTDTKDMAIAKGRILIIKDLINIAPELQKLEPAIPATKIDSTPLKLNEISQAIKATNWKTGFFGLAGGVVTVIDGQKKKLPTRVAAIYKILNDTSLTAADKLCQIIEQAEQGITKPGSYQKDATLHFYGEIVKGTHLVTKDASQNMDFYKEEIRRIRETPLTETNDEQPLTVNKN